MVRQRIFIPILSFLIILNSCTEEEPVNQPPLAEDQQFFIAENSPVGTIVGTVQAEDPEETPLTFNFADFSHPIFKLDASSGDLIVKDDSLLDFEFSSNEVIPILVFDEESSTSATISIVIEDIDDGPLTNYQKFLIDHIAFLAFGKHSSSREREYTSRLLIDLRCSKWRLY